LCGYEFSFQVKLKEGASTDEIIKKELPITAILKIDRITLSAIQARWLQHHPMYPRFVYLRQKDNHATPRDRI